MPERGFRKERIVYEGETRNYFVYAPRKLDDKPLPLVFVFHSAGGTAMRVAHRSGIHQLAEKEMFIAVFPSAARLSGQNARAWNAGNCCGEAVIKNVDDVGFIRTLIDRLSAEHRIDPKRIYSMGFSNGAMMSYRLGYELSDRIAAVGAVSGAFNFENPHEVEPVSVIAFHGTEDENIDYNGGPSKFERRERVDKPVSYAIDFWKRNDGCLAAESEISGRIVHDVCRDGKQDSAVELYTIVGATHIWPADEDIRATNLIWEFFKQHPKK